MGLEINKVYNMDCLELMREMVRGGVIADWLIADPPYGINAGRVGAKGYEDCKYGATQRRTYKESQWDKERLTKEYFELMFQVSKNQIIFGGNYYTDYLPPTKSWVVWDKICEEKYRNDFADCEMAWCSKGQARVFHYLYNGMIQGDMKNKDERFHPTQKPTQIIIQLLNYYTNENDLILDPFMGSFTTAVACHKMQRRFIGAELDKEYFEKGYARLNKAQSQISIFDL